MPGVIAAGPPKAQKLSKNQQRRAKKKQQKQESDKAPTSADKPEDGSRPEPQSAVTNGTRPSAAPAVVEPEEEELTLESFDLPPEDPLLAQFAAVFARFQDENSGAEAKESEKQEVFFDDDDNIQDEDEEEATKQRLSKKARKEANKLSIAELKAIAPKPELVEWTDPSGPDPRLLVHIKSARNVVPVPSHWSLKREYLSSKRGIEKAAFALPKFIAETGIGEMRDAVLEKQAEQSLKQAQRARVQPKMGKLDIDYQKLYEAFFRRQTKPQLTRYGEVYYEGKEYETNLRHLRPGELSDELREALNMPPGAPPPWLINQQKIGPPPSYPALKIPGLNAPPPPGGAWGFHPGGWGKPPTDDDGKPLWGGDPYGTGITKTQEKDDTKDELVDRSLWGELQVVEEEEEEEEEEEDDEEEDDDDDDDAADASGVQTQMAGLQTPGGISSTVPTDIGTHSMAGDFNLRKNRRGDETEDPQYPRSAGTVLQERNIRAEGFFGGERVYDLGQQRNNVPVLGAEQRGSKRKAGDLDVSVDVDALERDDKLSRDEVRRQYEAQRAQEKAGGWKGVVDQEDLSNMVQEEMAKRQKRDQERRAKR